MIKRNLLIFISLITIIISLSGCSKTDTPDEKYAAVAKLYMETLVRELDESDEATLALCSDSVRNKIIETSASVQELLRQREYLTKEEVEEFIGGLDVYYETRKIDFLSMQQNGLDVGDVGLTIEDYKPIQVLTQETYKVNVKTKTLGSVTLEDGNVINVTLPKKFEGEVQIELLAYNDGIYKYSAILDGNEVWIYLDVENGIVERLKEAEAEELDSQTFS